MLGERPGTVKEARAFDLHGVTYHDVTVELDDGAVVGARLGPEAVPPGLEPGARVMAQMAAGLIVSLRPG